MAQIWKPLPISDLTRRNLGPTLIQEIIIKKSDMVLLQFSTSKQIPELPALGHAIIPRVWLGSLELTQSHKNSIAIEFFPLIIGDNLDYFE